MPLEFLRRKGGDAAAAPSGPAATPGRAASSNPMPEEVVAQEHLLRLTYAGKTSEGVRIQAGPAAVRELPQMLDGIAQGEIEVVEPLPIELGGAAPSITRVDAAAQWLQAHHEHSPITRHALLVLESVDAVDLAFDTLACAMLDGDIDTAGYPEYNAIVGGVAGHWDEATGDLIVRGVVGWGGRGARGDTDRIAARILASLLSNILASRFSLGLTTVERPAAASGRGGVKCNHCGFASAHERTYYCPKCGMRLLRS